MFDAILSLLGPIAPYIMGVLLFIAGWFGVKSKINEHKANKATAEAAIQRQRADSMDAATKAQEDAQKAARGVPKPAKPNPKKRDGLKTKW